MAHALQSVTEENPIATVMSIDGIGAFDLVSRKAMLQALMRIEGGPAVMPSVRMFCGQASPCLWEDDEGVVHKQGRRRAERPHDASSVHRHLRFVGR